MAIPKAGRGGSRSSPHRSYGRDESHHRQAKRDPTYIGVGGHFREMNDLLLLGVDLVPATVSECAVGGSDLFLRRSMHWIGPFWTVGIHKVGAHITVALVHEEALTVGSIGRIWASGPGFHDVFRRNQLPRAHDSVANFPIRFD